jgi:hypothetical protein
MPVGAQTAVPAPKAEPPAASQPKAAKKAKAKKKKADGDMKTRCNGTSYCQ